MDLKLYCHCTAFHGDCFCPVVPCLNRRFDCTYMLLRSYDSVCNGLYVQPCYPVIKQNITPSMILTKEFICF